jgi:hypothetical protein
MDKSTYESLRLRKNDVLICRTNGNPKLVGKSAIVQKDYEFAYASYLFKIRPKKELIKHRLYRLSIYFIMLIPAMSICNELLSQSTNRYAYIELVEEILLFIATIIFYK